MERRVRLPHQPALDGLRGVSLLGVLAFHAGFSWAAGGYLGVSTFFTLSGFLITALLVAEWQQTGRIRLAGFWAWRARRLLPASLLALAGIALYAAVAGTAGQRSQLPADVLSSLVYTTNWWLLASGASYAALFEAPTPVQHYWSLAIEGQFYLLFPLCVAGLLAAGRGSRAWLAAGLGALALASAAISFALDAGGALPERIYYGSDTRAAELLVGGLLALAVGARAGGTSRRVAVAGAAALAALLGLWATADLATPWIYRGGLAGHGALSALVLAAALQSGGAVRVLLGWGPLRWLGRISYGAYLYHWPVYLWLSPEATGLAAWPLFGLRVGITLALAQASYRWVERPVRAGAAGGGIRLGAAWVAGAAGVVAAAWGVRAGAPLDPIGLRTQSDPPSSAREADPAGLRVAFFGDSVAQQLFWGLAGLATGTPELARPALAADRGCGIARGGEIRRRGRLRRMPERCRTWESSWPRMLAEYRPDLAVVLTGSWDVADRRLPGEDVWREPGDPVLDAYLLDEMTRAVEVLAEGGARVVWLTSAAQGLGQPPDLRARTDRFNALVHELGRRFPERLRVLDLDAYVRGLAADALADDGVHLRPRAVERAVRDWLAPRLRMLAGGPTQNGQKN